LNRCTDTMNQWDCPAAGGFVERSAPTSKRQFANGFAPKLMRVSPLQQVQSRHLSGYSYTTKA
jgi:hypothetical protein